MTQAKILVVGGGLAGLAATMKAAESGAHVDLMSIVPTKRSHTVCAQGGINAAIDTHGAGDSTWEHFDDTIYGGDFVANQPIVKDLCEKAPSIVALMDRMGVPFNRTPEGHIDVRAFGGAKFKRTAYAGATTGQQLLYALDEQVRRYVDQGTVTMYEGWEFLQVILNSKGQAKGAVAMNRSTMEIRAFAADVVILAAGGIGMIYGKSTNSVINTGSAHSAVYQQGASYANGEFIQVHPTTIPGGDKLRLMSESARGEGGRVWVPKEKGDTRDPRQIPESERWYFLEERYPAYGNLVPRDIATRNLFDVCVNLGLGIGGQNKVYLDLTHKSREFLEVKLGGIIEIYRKYVGKDPAEVPMEIYPGMHYTMGGLWTNRGLMTSIDGLYAAGECNYQHHGANRLGANSLLSCIYDGLTSAPNALGWLADNTDAATSTELNAAVARQQEVFDGIFSLDGSTNPYQLHAELGDLMTRNVTIIRYNDKLQETENELVDLKGKMQSVKLPDNRRFANHAALFVNNMRNMLELAHVVVKGALLRDESRGAHYKPDFPERNDEKFLKTTRADFVDGGPKIEYEEVDVSLIKPRPRTYDIAKTVAKK